jgi:hypothetical protein
MWSDLPTDFADTLESFLHGLNGLGIVIHQDEIASHFQTGNGGDFPQPSFGGTGKGN